MIKINLVPAEILAKAKQKQQILQVSAVAVLGLIILAGVSLAHYWKLDRLERQYAYDQGELKKLQVVVDKVTALEKTKADLKSHLDVIDNLLKGRPMYPYFMSDFVRSVPAGVHIKDMSTSGGGSSASPVKVKVTAEARTEEDIASWTKKLADSGRFSGVELGAVTLGEKGFSFSLTSTYTPSL